MKHIARMGRLELEEYARNLHDQAEAIYAEYASYRHKVEERARGLADRVYIKDLSVNQYTTHKIVEVSLEPWRIMVDDIRGVPEYAQAAGNALRDRIEMAMGAAL